MSTGRKCPNCGYISNEDFCPNCDRYNVEDAGVITNDELEAKRQQTSNEQTMNEALAKHQAAKKAEQQSQQESAAPKPKPTKMKQEKQDIGSKKKRKGPKILSLVVLICLVVGGIGGYKYYQKQQEEARIAAIQKEGKQLVAQVGDFYTNPEHVFIKATVTEDDVAKLKQKINDFSDKSYREKAQKQLADVEERQAALLAVNRLFEAPVIVGEEYQEQALKVDGKPADVKLSKETDAFYELVKRALTSANEQANLFATAKQQMAVLYQGDVQPNVTRAQYDEAKATVEKIKNQTLKATYTEQLAKVEQALRVKEEAAKKAAVQASAPKTVTNIPSSGNETGAWAWAPGIKEKVMGECLRRGYIVNGGYELRKKEVRNGEGFYDLYATNTQSSLLRNRQAKELPIYLVTINCKTGWFKGNGPKGS